MKTVMKTIAMLVVSVIVIPSTARADWYYNKENGRCEPSSLAFNLQLAQFGIEYIKTGHSCQQLGNGGGEYFLEACDDGAVFLYANTKAGCRKAVQVWKAQ